MSTCRLCDLPTPDPPITEPAVEGVFCCRGCLAVARALSDVEGVHAIEANYGMETARVVYDPDAIEETDLPERLSAHGYQFRLPDDADDSDARSRQRDTAQRLVVGGFLSMLVMPWYFVYFYPSYVGIETGILEIDATTPATVYVPMVLIALMTTGVLLDTGAPILRGAWVSVRTRRPNMDLLVSVAALSAYGYSTVALATGSTHLYYDVTVVAVMTVTLGRYYEGHVQEQATSMLSEITTARESEATRLTDDGRETVGIDRLEPGDELVVAPGDRVRPRSTTGA